MAETWRSDADYLAALRGANLDEANGSADIRTQQERARRRLAETLPELARAGTFARKGINTGFEGRGLFRSGMRQEGIARQQYDEARQVADVQTGTADYVGDLEGQLARLRADTNRRRTDAGLGAQQREYAFSQQAALERERAAREEALAAELRQMREGAYQQAYGLPPAPRYSSTRARIA